MMNEREPLQVIGKTLSTVITNDYGQLVMKFTDGSQAIVSPSLLYDETGNPLGALANPLRQRPTDTTVAPVNLTAAWNGTGSPPVGSQIAVATNGLAAVGVGITGTWVATLQFEGTVDGTNWFPVVAVPYGGGQGATSVTANGNWRIHSAGLQQVRVRCSAFTSGTAVVALEAANGPAWTGSTPQGANLTAPLLYNGATYDAWTNNQQGTLLASAARTATTVSPVQTNLNARGVALFLNITAASGTGGLTVGVQFTDPVSGTVATLNLAGTALTAVSEGLYITYPAAEATSAAVRATFNQSLPRIWNANVNHGDTSSYTYSLGYCYLT